VWFAMKEEKQKKKRTEQNRSARAVQVLLLCCALALGAVEAQAGNYDRGRSHFVSATGRVTDTSVVTAGDIHAAGVKTLKQAIALLPGVYLMSDQDGNSRLDIRGFGATSVKVLLNGIPVTSPYDGEISTDFVSLKDVARIELVRGGSSVLYGPGGTAGTINILTKGDAPNIFRSMHANFQNGKGSKSGFHAQKRLDGMTLFANGGYTRLRSKLGNGPAPGDDGSHTLGRYHWTETAAPLNIVERKKEDEPRVLSRGKLKPRDDVEAMSIQLGAEHRFVIPLDVRGWVYASRLNERDVHRDDFLNYSTENTVQDSSTKTFRTGGTVQAAYHLGAPGTLSAGFSVERDQWRSSDFETFTAEESGTTSNKQVQEDYTVNTWSAALEYELELWKHAGLVLGSGWHGHSSANREDEVQWSGLGGVYVDPLKNTRLRALVSRKVRFPSMEQLYDQDAGNLALQSELATHYELGVIQKIPDWQTSVNLSVFRIDTQNTIRNIDDHYVDDGDYRFYGFESSVSNSSIKNLRLRFAYTFLDPLSADMSGNYKAFQERPDNTFALEGWYKLPEGLKVYFSWNYLGYGWSESVDSEEDLSRKSFHIVNMRVSKKFSRVLEGYVVGDNLLDVREEDGYRLPWSGRTLSVGMSWKF